MTPGEPLRHKVYAAVHEDILDAAYRRRFFMSCLAHLGHAEKGFEVHDVQMAACAYVIKKQIRESAEDDLYPFSRAPDEPR